MRTRALALTAVLLLVLAACGSGEEADPSVGQEDEAPAASDGPDLSAEEFEDLTGQEAVEVQARDNRFVAPYIEVSAGTEVTFANRGRNQHNVLPVEDGAFKALEADDIPPGSAESITFVEPGDYAYYCSLHGTTTKGMVGAIRVVE